MKQIVQSARTGKLTRREVPEPRVKAGHLVVETRASLISAGTERMVVEFARKSLAGKARARPDLVSKVLAKARRDGILATMKAVLARLDEPLPLGYSAAGLVRDVGEGLEGRFRVGQRVAVAGAGLANHAEVNVIPANLAAPIPDDVSDEEACFATLGSIALHSVRNLNVALGEVVAVLGVGLVGQMAVQFLALAGCRVVALDYNQDRLALARRLGAEMAWNLGATGLEEAVEGLTGGKGCDGILIAAATDSSEPLLTAAAIARDRARISIVGMTGTEFPYREFMKKELSLVVSRSYGPGRYDEDYESRGMKYPVGWVRWTEADNLAECTRLMSPSLRHSLAVEPLISHRFAFEKAEDAYALVTENREPHLGVVLRYAPAIQAPAKPKPPASALAASGTCVLGVIGAGAFARTVLLPGLKGQRDCRLHTIATQRGMTAEHAQQAFGFLHATTDAAEVFDNPEINAVLIATRHGSHAELTARALAAGKAVLVEKPLALDRAQLDRVIQARNESKAFFQVGFNRRFAPLSVKFRERLAALPCPKSLLLRVNAGALPPESWQNTADDGGGRILGEACHFIDLARFFIGADIVGVQAVAVGGAFGPVCDDLTVTLNFADGSLATLLYTALGDTAFSKELYEGYAGGSVITIDNFRSLTVAENGRVKTTKSGGQDKGHNAELAAFVQAVALGGPSPILEEEQIQSTLATLAVLESLRSGERVEI